jgi:hypothetical protein
MSCKVLCFCAGKVRTASTKTLYDAFKRLMRRFHRSCGRHWFGPARSGVDEVTPEHVMVLVLRVALLRHVPAMTVCWCPFTCHRRCIRYTSTKEEGCKTLQYSFFTTGKF